MALKVQPGLPAPLPNTSDMGQVAMLRDAQQREPWTQQDIFNGLTAGAGVYSPTYLVAGRTALKLVVYGTISSPSIKVWGTVGNWGDTSYVQLGSTIVAAGLVAIDITGFTAIKFEYAADAGTAKADFSVVRV